MPASGVSFFAGIKPINARPHERVKGYLYEHAFIPSAATFHVGILADAVLVLIPLAAPLNIQHSRLLSGSSVSNLPIIIGG